MSLGILEWAGDRRKKGTKAGRKEGRKDGWMDGWMDGWKAASYNLAARLDGSGANRDNSGLREKGDSISFLLVSRRAFLTVYV